ncbi:NgoFVII family restriction endonuclease [Candidatus Gracilibacteria bacterium]|nr:NgoFVII family restriction endonuclease [Candidatus Gracilibacteria bacterium]
MFFENQSQEQKDEYQKFLKVVGSLSNLFSDSEIPYLYYRIAEKIFCRSFSADDLSRSDVSVDARKDGLGVGLKTFLIGNKKTFQKVAEFNADKNLYESLEGLNKIKKISELRNERIDFTQRLHGLYESIYHCVLRDINKFIIFEERLEKINIESIVITKNNKSSIIFSDGINEYSFLVSKSTLTKRFNTDSILHSFDIEIIKDPLLELNNIFGENGGLELLSSFNSNNTIYLPLYGRNNIVGERSGLNHWNARGRTRDRNEIYIPIPSIIHEKFPNFFPDRDNQFSLKLPNGQQLSVKICQDGGKALMSNPNRELGRWLLRDVLNLEEGELLTYERLQVLGIDSVRIDKIDDLNFEINFSDRGKYEEFKETFS